jgi:hypothetical protein
MALASCGIEVAFTMTEPLQHTPCAHGCKAVVPVELQAESLCLLHFIQEIERACADMRREAAMDKPSPARRQEMQLYVKSTALKLSDVTTGSTRLTDEIKKRVLTNFLTLMNLQESVDRAVNRLIKVEPLRPSVRAVPFVAIAGH